MACTPSPSLGGGSKILGKSLMGRVGNFYFGEGVNFVGWGMLLKRFARFSYLNYSFVLNLNVKVCIRFIAFLQISHCFFICQALCRMRGLCISFTSSCFSFQSDGGVKSLRTGEVT